MLEVLTILACMCNVLAKKARSLLYLQKYHLHRTVITRDVPMNEAPAAAQLPCGEATRQPTSPPARPIRPKPRFVMPKHSPEGSLFYLFSTNQPMQPRRNAYMITFFGRMPVNNSWGGVGQVVVTAEGQPTRAKIMLQCYTVCSPLYYIHELADEPT